ncbi:MAG: hypothetical protein HC831_13470 [Chloroflexia bacterium]|nr:hypothetical protein [Chloroflexia bacterium]
MKNKDLREELIRCKEEGELSRAAIDMFMLMSERFGQKLTYVIEADRSDCKATAIMDCYQYWRGYNPEYPNAFAYITQIIKNGYAKGYRKLYGKMALSQKYL